MRRCPSKAAFWLGTAAAALAAYLAWLRPRQLRWGATDEEVARPMPGDELVAQPHFNATRGVTVHARPDQIWPWLPQMGIGRAGWYSYDMVDNLGRPSARRILPEYQQPHAGDLVPMSPVGEMGVYVRAYEPGRYLLWDDKGQGKTTWVWGLYPLDDHTTRLISRVRLRYDWLSPGIIFNLLLDVGDIVMMRKCMLGIKERAEALGSQMTTIDLSQVNCYLFKTHDGFVLVDTGLPASRARLLRELEAAGCTPGTLRLIVLTHCDPDHTGSVAYLREHYAAPVAMHRGDAGTNTENGLVHGRKAQPDRLTPLGRLFFFMGGLVVRLSGRQVSDEDINPDIYLEDGQDLSAYGLDARVLHLPGHTKGSIGILTADGDLLCGDFLMNMFGPAPHFMINDMADFNASLAKLERAGVRTVYPGHGKAFAMAAYARRHG